MKRVNLRIAFVIAFTVLTAITMSLSAQNILTSIEFAEDVPPTVTVIDNDIEKVIEIAVVATIKARSESSIVINHSMYLVEYENSTYQVSLFHIDDEDYPIDLNKFTADAPYIFTSTRVADVRTWLKNELYIFYTAEISAY